MLPSSFIVFLILQMDTQINNTLDISIKDNEKKYYNL